MRSCKVIVPGSSSSTACKIQEKKLTVILVEPPHDCRRWWSTGKKMVVNIASAVFHNTSICDGAEEIEGRVDGALSLALSRLTYGGDVSCSALESHGRTLSDNCKCSPDRYRHDKSYYICIEILFLT